MNLILHSSFSFAFTSVKPNIEHRAQTPLEPPPSMSPSRTPSQDYIHHRMIEDYVDDHLSSDSFTREQNPDADFPSDSIPDVIALNHREACSSSQDAAVLRRPDTIQFLVLIPSQGKTLVLQGKPEDKVHSVHEKIQSLTGIAVAEQRLMYGREYLECDQTLSECTITNDSGLHLVGRRKNSWHPKAWQVIDELVWTICRLCKGEKGVCTEFAKSKMMDFVNMIQSSDVGLAVSHLSIFTSYCVPEALVMLYKSADKRNKVCAEHSIQDFIDSATFLLPQPISSQCLPIVLRFCELLRRPGAHDDHVYRLCRSSLGVLLKHVKKVHGGGNNRVVITLQVIISFVAEIASKVSEGLVSSMESISSFGPSRGDVLDFVSFLRPLKAAVIDQTPLPVPMQTSCTLSDQSNKIKFLYVLFDDLFTKLLMCLHTMEDLMEKKIDGGWEEYLVILKQLYFISKLYKGAEEYFWKNLRHYKLSLCHLIVRYAKKGEDYEWIVEHKEVTNFEARRHLVMLLLPDLKDDYEDLDEMLIDRSQVLDESFVFLAQSDPDRMRGGIFVEFQDEEATGPGVLREWFFLLCQEIFNPKNHLFVACPNEPRRFFPNPASKVHPMHLEYYNFAGRIIALALMYKLQVGIFFDRSFFLQLAGINVSLEDIKDADPYLHSSCRQILDMDPLAVDEDALGLTFVWEIEEFESMKVVEFLPGGKNISVNSRNRKEYVDLLIHHRFVTSVAEQITHFAQGFTDIVNEERIRKMFFNSLDLEDFDKMLHGSESAISVEDWKAHTDCVGGYLATDPQICWFWKIVGGMTAKQRQVLLFFWISLKHLPIEGFRGLASRLYIYKSKESIDHLPSSHTCFYQLCIPVYPSMSVMQDRLNVITQDHFGCSFGTS